MEAKVKLLKLTKIVKVFSYIINNNFKHNAEGSQSKEQLQQNKKTQNT